MRRRAQRHIAPQNPYSFAGLSTSIVLRSSASGAQIGSWLNIRPSSTFQMGVILVTGWWAAGEAGRRQQLALKMVWGLRTVGPLGGWAWSVMFRIFVVAVRR